MAARLWRKSSNCCELGFAFARRDNSTRRSQGTLRRELTKPPAAKHLIFCLLQFRLTVGLGSTIFRQRRFHSGSSQSMSNRSPSLHPMHRDLLQDYLQPALATLHATKNICFSDRTFDCYCSMLY